MDPKALHDMLALREKLVAHPKLKSITTLVDAELDKAEVDAKAAADKLVADQRNKALADAAKADHEAAVMAAAAEARRRLAEAEALKVQPADQKTVAEADAIAKARADEAMRLHQQAFPAPAHVPPPGAMPPPPPVTHE